MSSILPKGIVVNTAEISGDIERIDSEPLALEEIAKLWKVYTTTKRRLLDPTAERLENYWWRIWGSRQRNLRGATVARLFAEISDGASFVPLRGPLNRDESGGRPILSFTRGSGLAKSTVLTFRPESESSNDQASSVSKHPSGMPPPILKKNRGPSSTGPRPTARFISPHGSEEEDANEVSSETGPNAHVVVRPPTPELYAVKDKGRTETSAPPRKKAHGFVAATAAHKRRPGVSRRPNSDPALRGAETTSASSSSKETCESVTEILSQRKDPAKFQGTSNAQGNSSQALESRSMTKTSRKTRTSKSGNSRSSVRKTSASSQTSELDSSTSLKPTTQPNGLGVSRNLQRVDTDQLEYSAKEGTGEGYQRDDKLKQKGMAEVHAKSKRLESRGQQAVGGGQGRAGGGSGLGGDGHKKLEPNQTALHQLPTTTRSKSSVSLAPTLTAATGNTDVSHVSDLAGVAYGSISPLGRGVRSEVDLAKQRSLFAKRPVQLPASASALRATPAFQSSDSLSRSKSQLTFLLERDRAKTGEKKEVTSSTTAKGKEPGVKVTK